MTKFDDIYFPVAKNASNWATANRRRDMFLRLLTPDERAVIDSLKPYKGGDPDIWPLHRLDIERKHSRLLVVEPKPAMFAVRDFGNEDIIDIGLFRFYWCLQRLRFVSCAKIEGVGVWFLLAM